MDTQMNTLNTSFPKNCRVIFEEALMNTEIISTGCSSLDDLLDGGLWTGELIEVCGVPGNGKTEFCKTVCSSLLRQPNTNALYIDSSGSFVCERLVEIVASKHGPCTPQFLQDALSRINYLRIFSAQSLLVELRRLEEQLSVKTGAFFCRMKLLIIDSITPLISPILGGNQTEGHMLMMEIGRILKRIAVEHSISCIVVNGVVLDTNPESLFSHKPALGKSWVSVPHRRIYIESDNDSHAPSKSFAAFLVKSSQQAVGRSVKFCITSKALECMGSR